MINLKKGLIAVAGLAMVAGVGGVALTSCSDPYENVVTLWAPESDISYFEDTVIPAFKEAHKDVLELKDEAGNVTGTLDVQVLAQMGEGDIWTNAGKDIASAADVFCMADDNARSMNDAGYLIDFNDKKADLIASEGQDAVDAFMVDDDLLAVPYRNDNSYMLYYNTNIVSDEQAKSMNTILEAAAQANATVYFQIGNSWVLPSVLFSEGKMEIRVVNDETVQVADFASNGKVAEALYDFVSLYKKYTSNMVASDQADTAGILAGLDPQSEKPTAAYVIYNFWNETQKELAKIPEASRPEVKCTTLPTFSSEDGSRTHQLKPFVGYKGMAVKSNVSEKKAAAAKAFALFAASEENQALRVTELQQGVTNLTVQKEYAEELAALPHMAAINKTIESGEYVAQGANVAPTYWTPISNQLCSGILNATGDAFASIEDCKAKLQTLCSSDGWYDYSTLPQE